MTDIRQGRVNQKHRTREAIVQAGAALLREGSTPTVIEAATAATVSQATAYRYFPTQESLLAAIVDREMHSATEVLTRSFEPLGDPEEDVLALAEAIFDEIVRREPEHRSLLRLALDQWFVVRGGAKPEHPIERGGRTAFLLDALAPLTPRLGEPGVYRLAEALSLAVGIEAQLALRDVWQLPKANALDVIRWTCRALIRQAVEDGKDASVRGPGSATRSVVARSRRRTTAKPTTSTASHVAEVPARPE